MVSYVSYVLYKYNFHLLASLTSQIPHDDHLSSHITSNFPPNLNEPLSLLSRINGLPTLFILSLGNV